MKLLIATDHRFHGGGTDRGIYDTYCFDRAFFDDYVQVFPEVRVAARVRRDGIPDGAARADGDGVEFGALADVGGARWTAAPRFAYLRELGAAVRWADAVCVRIPSVAGWHAAELARRAGKPTMFELIGDPVAALAPGEHGRLRSLFGAIDARRVRRITANAVAGSYVSKAHLQRAYPPGPATRTDSISSIRLDESGIAPPRPLAAPPDPLVVVLVASLVPVKRHDVLLRAVAEARRLGATIRLELVGGGGLRQPLEALAASLGIAEVTTFHGHVADRAAIDAILAGADVFAMTSASEGMPRAMIEAMARGLPSVGSDAGGIAELLGPSERFPAGDHHRLGWMLAELQHDPGRLAGLSAAATETAKEYSSRRLAARRRALLEHVAGAVGSEPG